MRYRPRRPASCRAATGRSSGSGGAACVGRGACCGDHGASSVLFWSRGARRCPGGSGAASSSPARCFLDRRLAAGG
ncbi:Os02g0542000, partial [Oryza sativa Japonica Group]